MGYYLIATNDGQAQKVEGTKFKIKIGDKEYNVFTHGAPSSLRLSHLESGRCIGKLESYMRLGDKRLAAQLLINSITSRIGIQAVYNTLDNAPLAKDLPIKEDT